MKTHVVTEVVAKDLCCNCGVCAGACPADALTVHIQNNGDLAPSIMQSACEPRKNCQLCLSICPMIEGIHDPRDQNEKLFGSNDERRTTTYHEDIGWHLRSVLGWRKDPALRRASASGGLATWCLEKLLESGAVTRVASVRLAQDCRKGMFEFYPATSIEELRNSAGSIYQPIEISGMLKKIAREKTQRWAIVGVPCLCAGIRNIKHLRQQIPYVLGLACGMYQNIFYTEMLLEKSGVNRNSPLGIEFRRKSDGGSPSNFRFRGTDSWGPGKEVPYHGLPFYLGSNAYFRLNACNFCMDVFAETADACFMDAWLPEYREDWQGTSIAVVRNLEVDSLFHEGLRTGEIAVETISAERVVQSQQGHVRRKRQTVSLRRGNCNSVPYDGFANRTIENLNWWLQRKTQERSKRAWSGLGRRYGRTVFWISMADLLLLHKTVKRMVRALSLPRLFTRKLKALTSKWRHVC